MSTQLKHILQLIRYKNLIVIVITQYLMRYFVIVPMLALHEIEPQFSNLNFFLLVIATTFLAAAGYAINDYFDRKVDLINHPDSVLIGTIIPRRTAMSLNNALNAIAVLAGFYISWRIGHFNLGFLFVLISGILWFYSSTYKKWFLVGNIIVAVFSALVPFLVLVYEIPLLNKIEGLNESQLQIISIIFIYITGYSVFAFLTTLSREIIKDIEDITGDVKFGRKTLPAVTGIITSKTVVVLLNVFIASLIGYISRYFFGDLYSMLYCLIALIIPLLYVSYRILAAKQKSDYRFSGNMMKVIMLLGLLYSVFIPFLI